MTILDRVSAEGSRARRLVSLTSAAAAVGAAIAILAFGAIILGGGRWLSAPALLPFAWWLGVGALTVGLIRWLPRRLFARATDEAVASEAERERGLRPGALVGLVQVAPAGGAFIGLHTRQLTQLVGQGALAPQHAKRLSLAAGGALAVALGVAGTSWTGRESVGDGWRALLHPILAMRGTLVEPMTFDGTPATIVRGDTVVVKIHAPGRRAVTLTYRETGAASRTEVLAVADDNASLLLGSVDAHVTLVATDSRTEQTFDIKVVERPFAGDVAARAVYPTYLRRAAEVLAPDGALRVPEGTTLEITARAAGVADVSLASERDTIPLVLEAGRVRGRIVARGSGNWQWVSSTAGADLPGPLALDVMPDSAPRIEIVTPTHDTLVTPGDAVRLVIAAMDDHGLADIRLRTWHEREGGAKDGDKSTALSGVNGERWMGELELDLGGRNLKPGDVVVVVAEARDAAPWGRVGMSQRLELRVPTADARREAATDAADSAVARANAAAQAQKSLEKRTADAARAAGNRNDPTNPNRDGTTKEGPATFEAQERAREITEAQRALAERAEQLTKEASRLSQELQKAGVLDSAMSQEIKEAERLLREAMTPELMKQLRELEQQRQKMSAEELQQSLEKLGQPQKDMREALEKAREMLQRAALEGKMEALKDQTSELAQEQRKFADSANAAQRPGTAKELAERAKAARQEMQELIDRMQKEQAQAAKEGTQKAASEAEESARKMQEAMEKAMKELGGQQAQDNNKGQSGQQQSGQQSGQQNAAGKEGGAQQSAKDAADAMQRASDAMGEARQSQVNQWKQELTEALDRSIQETLQMARQQEQIGSQARDGATSQARAEQGALQQGVQQTSERLNQQGQKSALVSPASQRAMDAAKQRVEQTTRDLNEGASGQQVQNSAQSAADALRQTAASLARDRERAGNSQTASGLPEFMQQMREMAGQQGQINAQSAQMLPNAAQMAQGQAQEQAAKDLAQKQRQLAQKLEDAADADRSGRADALAREARQLAEQIDRGMLDQSVIDRQQRLFTRMLDAGRTLEQDQRDESDRREAKSGQGITSDGPATGSARGAAAQKFREPTYDELRGLTPEERRLVLDYFRRMNGKKP
ncbi:MAG TPA: hypothetical protein VJR92_11945 [Gemmatimonadaceae bacterium]|nr:hypothetical protein [Gemmatimonadaceae bacterium]